jgi:cytoplasmic iron level regulating protein YaaA (DUF328/UPF0246 family)
VLIILPPSEAKRPPPRTGRVLDLDRLAFPALNPMRKRVMKALIETSARPDALERLRVRPGLIKDVVQNTALRETPTQPAWQLYAGPLYQGLDPDSLSEAAISRANRSVVIASALWGAVRPTDLIPAHRLDVCSRLIGMDRLEPIWRTVLPAELAAAAGRQGVVLDLRSPSYRAIGLPAEMEDRTVTLRVLPQPGERTIGDVIAKRVRGQVARHLLESDADPASPDELVDAISGRWPARLDAPARGKSWTIRLRPAD